MSAFVQIRMEEMPAGTETVGMPSDVFVTVNFKPAQQFSLVCWFGFLPVEQLFKRSEDGSVRVVGFFWLGWLGCFVKGRL